MKKTKTKGKMNKVNLWAIIVSIIAMFALICIVIGVIVLATMLKDKPDLNLSDFDSQESSIIYDQDNNKIADLGLTIRQNVSYDEIPNCVVDAFVAVEDSRFFEHNGFDVPRFTKAFIVDIMAGSFEQGGSTFTMQLCKNTYFVDDEGGINAPKKISRKVQEIALAMELERNKSKKAIFDSYINKLNFGGDSNIRGIQKAAQYYFGKDVQDCGLVEGALLAGVINAPNYYNPFWNLEAAQERVGEVLYLMNYHGYITDTEYELASAVRIEDLLNDPYQKSGSGEGIPYQAYIDAVVEEVYDLTGLDPYTTTMHIYTYMNRGVQEEMDRIQAGNMDGYLEFPDDYFECASICMNVSTGQIIGVLGGRNYADGGALLLNHAIDQYKQPGSSIKPILDYSLAFENLGWATDHVLCDKPMYMDSSKQNLVYNFSGTYVGDVTLKQAVGNSINTTAIQTLQAVIDAKKTEYVVDYAQSIGYDFTLDTFNVQFGIGGSDCVVTCKQQAAALAMLMNYGVYNTPHTIERIEFTNGKSPIAPVYQSTQALSEAAAFMTTELLYSNVQSYGGTYNYVKIPDYPVYAKTGTTDYGTSGKQFGIPSGAIKDGWLIASTSEYSIATWVGYEKAAVGQQSYIDDDYYYGERPSGKITRLILDAVNEYTDETPVKLTRPNGVTSITHIIGTWPYAACIEGMDESLKTTGLIKTESARTVNLSAPSIEKMGDANVDLVESTGVLTIDWPKYPNENALGDRNDVKDISLKSGSEVIVAASGKVLFDKSWIYGPVKYMADITVTSNGSSNKMHVKSDEDSYTTKLSLANGDKVTVDCYYGFDNGSGTSNADTETFVIKNAAKRFTVPSADYIGSYDKMKTWATNNGIAFVEDPTENADSVGTFYVTDGYSSYTYGNEVVEVDGYTYTLVYRTKKEVSHEIKYTLINGNDNVHQNASVTVTPVTNDEILSITTDPESYEGLDIVLGDVASISYKEGFDDLKVASGTITVIITTEYATEKVIIRVNVTE